MKIPTLIVAALGLCLLSTRAADSPSEAGPEKQVPKGPLLKRVADFSKWQITFSYPQDREKNPPGTAVDYGPGPDPDYFPSPVRRVTLTRTKPRYLAITEDVRGKKVEQCSDGIDQFVVQHGSNDVSLFVNDPTVPTSLTDYNRVDFPDLEWISPNAYRGVQMLGDRSCLVFQKDGMTAWIDSQTRTPVRWQKRGETRVFQQLETPSGMVELPANVRRISERLKRDRARFYRPVPRGG